MGSMYSAFRVERNDARTSISLMVRQTSPLSSDDKGLVSLFYFSASIKNYDIKIL
jgi:hypothetical protein